MITKRTFIKIFENPIYRKKLDQIILNFFGLDISEKLDIDSEVVEIVHEIILFINTEFVLRIKVVDNNNLFKIPKKFYINLSFRKVNKYYELLIPCYFEIYCPYAKKHLKKSPKLFLIAALFSCKTKEEIEIVLNKLDVFTKVEKEDILDKLEMHK